MRPRLESQEEIRFSEDHPSKQFKKLEASKVQRVQVQKKKERDLMSLIFTEHKPRMKKKRQVITRLGQLDLRESVRKLKNKQKIPTLMG